jgi:uncharacterized protein
MPRPPAARIETVLDAAAYARTAGEIQQSFKAEELPRFGAAGAQEGSTATATLRFSEYDGQPVIDGELAGTAVLSCQRCMRPVAIPLQESFHVMIVPDERADEPGGYEPVVANAAHFDVRWFVEEQALLALPLVPMHEPQQCALVADDVRGGEVARQTPFENLRDMLRGGDRPPRV